MELAQLDAIANESKICTAHRRMCNYRKGSRPFRTNKNAGDSISGSSGNKGGVI